MGILTALTDQTNGIVRPVLAGLHSHALAKRQELASAIRPLGLVTIMKVRCLI